MTVEFFLELPGDFRPEVILEFHRRDRLGMAERVQDRELQKGIDWNGHPACLGLPENSSKNCR